MTQRIPLRAIEGGLDPDDIRGIIAAALAEGENITITPVGDTFVISSAGADALPFNPAGSDLTSLTVEEAIIEAANSSSGGLPEGGSSAQVLTSQSGGTSFWFGNVAVLLENGATVPEGTPVGTIVFQKGL